MGSAHKREKKPEAVRRALLDCAARIAIEHGLARVTVQAVADAAHVTKGGLLHHFASKQALLDALFVDLADAYENEIESRMTGRAHATGVFTRAYVETVIADVAEPSSRPRAILAVLAIGDARMRALWAERFARMLGRHADTDDTLDLATLRFAADGYWLSELIGSDPRDPARVRDSLLQSIAVA
ncbi:TetR/AcrR family transcriptional regulator [Salinisphaera hydrothermalis]|uniref:TetR/AcrR family transcriptional regulator n=1 Tax=Salinisphaera hydrothermalis TaxID=563188 RepID=UPI0033401CB0